MVKPHIVVVSALLSESQSNCEGQITIYGWEGVKKQKSKENKLDLGLKSWWGRIFVLKGKSTKPIHTGD